MRRSRKINIAIIVTALFVLIAVCAELYRKRYHGSDVYPLFSSFRSDPSGAKVLYESLNGIDGLDVVRNMRPIAEMKNAKETCLLMIGSRYVDQDTLAFALSGGRVVVCYSTFFRLGGAMRHLTESDGKALSMDVRKEKLVTPPKFPVKVVPADKFQKEMELVPFHYYSLIYFKLDSDDWRKVYSMYGKPVMIERRYWSGSLVLCGDSYFLSNEAMANRPSGDLLIYLLGGRKKVVFEETHLGSYKERNIVWLINKYNLNWYLLTIACAAVLFSWRSLLAPSDLNRPDDGIDEIAGDHDSLAASAGLFMQDYQKREMPQLCLEEYVGSGAGKRLSGQKFDDMKQAIGLYRPLDAYNEMVNINKKRETFTNDDSK